MSDLVNVVRCKDCVYSETGRDPIADIEYRVCRWDTYPRAVKDTHYCGYGERKDDTNAD